MSGVSTDAARRRGRLQFLALAVIFLGPVGFAFWMYYGGHLIPGHKVNHGTLMQPTRALPAATDLPTPTGASVGVGFLRHQWNLVYFAGLHCGDDCRQDLAELKKVRLAMDHERDRVHRVVLGLAPCCTEGEMGPADPDLTVAYVDSPTGQGLIAFLASADGSTSPSRAVFVVDPLGNLVMRFPPDVDRKGLIKDLDKLLRLSHIG